jgi:Flp pilus assembly protein TadG
MARGTSPSEGGTQRRRSHLAVPLLGAHRLRRDQRGVSVLEFGLFFPILALMVLATTDLARGLAASFALEQATQRTIEVATLGGRPRANYDFLVDEAMAAAGVPRANVTLGQFVECNGVRLTGPFTATCPAGQQTARYVTIAIYNDYTPLFGSIPFLGRLSTATDGKIRLTARSGVRVQ